ncbi:MAG: radical SAM protein [Nitrospirae bacterium]|nr:radical SAM protein [Nitrospirota bacterium]
MKYFNSRLELHRVPVSGGLEITKHCNLKCAHCYIGSARTPSAGDRPEMKTDKILGLLDEIRDAGCLSLLITGGEPLLRPDFGKVYERAKNNGMLVTVFTNGTLIHEEILELFSGLPPRSVEISLYGATARTYEAVTGVPGSYAKCIRGLEGLLAGGIEVGLKTVLMSVNRHEFFDIKNMAKQYGVAFRFDSDIFPRFDGDRMPLDLRVPIEDSVALEMSDPKRLEGWRKFLRTNGSFRLGERLYNCGAGVTNFHIDASGYLMPCLMIREGRFDLLSGDFVAGWKKMAFLHEKKTDPANPCIGCDKISLCSYCPAFFRLENGDENSAPEYLCSSGEARYNVIMKQEPISREA